MNNDMQMLADKINCYAYKALVNVQSVSVFLFILAVLNIMSRERLRNYLLYDNMITQENQDPDIQVLQSNENPCMRILYRSLIFCRASTSKYKEKCMNSV